MEHCLHLEKAGTSWPISRRRLVAMSFQSTLWHSGNERLKPRARLNPLSANAVETAFFIDGLVVQVVTLGNLVCLQSVVARGDGEFALIDRVSNFATPAEVVAPLVCRGSVAVVACTAGEAHCRKSDDTNGAAWTSAPNPEDRHKRTVQRSVARFALLPHAQPHLTAEAEGISGDGDGGLIRQYRTGAAYFGYWRWSVTSPISR